MPWTRVDGVQRWMVALVRIEDPLPSSGCLPADGQLHPSVLVQAARKEAEPAHAEVYISQLCQGLDQPGWLTHTHLQQRQHFRLKGLYSPNACALRLRRLDNAVLMP